MDDERSNCDAPTPTPGPPGDIGGDAVASSGFCFVYAPPQIGAPSPGGRGRNDPGASAGAPRHTAPLLASTVPDSICCSRRFCAASWRCCCIFCATAS